MNHYHHYLIVCEKVKKKAITKKGCSLQLFKKKIKKITHNSESLTREIKNVKR
jgi:hypothetical protein